MARLVLIEEIEPASWLLWTVRRKGSCLRDYRTNPPKKIRKYSTEQIKAYLNTARNFWEMAPEKSVREVTFWRERQWLKNVESRLVDLPPRERLLDVFTNGLGLGTHKSSGLQNLLARGSQPDVRFELKRWRKAFKHIVEGRKEFNHWDHDDAGRWRSDKTGIGWTSFMLEHSRHTDPVGWIETGDPKLDFSLLSMELCLGLSSKNNPLQPETKGSVRLDGMGIRRDGSFCVLEVKGPQDDGDLL